LVTGLYIRCFIPVLLNDDVYSIILTYITILCLMKHRVRVAINLRVIGVEMRPQPVCLNYRPIRSAVHSRQRIGPKDQPLRNTEQHDLWKSCGRLCRKQRTDHTTLASQGRSQNVRQYPQNRRLCRVVSIMHSET